MINPNAMMKEIQYLEKRISKLETAKAELLKALVRSNGLLRQYVPARMDVETGRIIAKYVKEESERISNDYLYDT